MQNTKKIIFPLNYDDFESRNLLLMLLNEYLNEHKINFKSLIITTNNNFLYSFPQKSQIVIFEENLNSVRNFILNSEDKVIVGDILDNDSTYLKKIFENLNLINLKEKGIELIGINLKLLDSEQDIYFEETNEYEKFKLNKILIKIKNIDNIKRNNNRIKSLREELNTDYYKSPRVNKRFLANHEIIDQEIENESFIPSTSGTYLLQNNVEQYKNLIFNIFNKHKEEILH